VFTNVTKLLLGDGVEEEAPLKFRQGKWATYWNIAWNDCMKLYPVCPFLRLFVMCWCWSPAIVFAAYVEKKDDRSVADFSEKR